MSQDQDSTSEDRDYGPVKWCKKCSRRHAARKPCELFLRARVVEATSSDGSTQKRTVRRWAH